ncbi:hypothetical protein [Corallococcus sp. 4LFB]|uniref:hypothetical protein n=1 Tax=Corallococcus sp. 4LFB TaxID=3383249 RepID=UPI0039755ACB
MAAGSGRERKETAKVAAFAAVGAMERLCEVLHVEAGHGDFAWTKCSRCLELMGVAAMEVVRG